MQIEVGGYTLEFFNYMEVGQGGPLACDLTIDGWLLQGRRFDPSPLAFEGKILLPMRKISFLNSGYVLTALDPRNSSINVISKIHGYMKLKGIEGRAVKFETTAWGEDTAFLQMP